MLQFAKKIFFLTLLFLCPFFLSGCSVSKFDVLGFLKGKIDTSPSVQCNYYDEKGNSVNAFFKDDWYKVDGGTVYNDKPGTVVSKDNKIWVWLKEASEGYIFDLSIDYSGYEIPRKKIIINPEQIIERVEFQKQNCSPGLIDNSVFEVPGDVLFTPYEEYLYN
ncbi:hypothetical protein C4578_01790 [Candidatus Microgenomates bacterium]|jgi:hypothetical protein|nr:MAG: hypothetical protein C4578_01790 [Candidatus Microgenomates bacterium]